MNNKLLVFGVPALLLIGLVAAASYYGVFSTTIEVQPSVTLTGNLAQTIDSVYSGEVVEGEEVDVKNSAPSERTITITEDSDEDISVSYVSYATLSDKLVDFEKDVWDIDESGRTAKVEYTLVGDSFLMKVTEGELEGYELVYYKDNSERFDSPAKAISNPTGNLPYEDDANTEEYDYCATGEYGTCNGAKIWYVPSDAINEDNTLDWSKAEDFLYETTLIQYNSEGQIVLYPGNELTIKPVYEVSDLASGEYTITTTIA